MTASLQPRFGAAELNVLLALVRAGNLVGAGLLLDVDGSTVFRTVQRAEKTLGQRLFERSRSGYRATELGLQLAHHAERIEAELEAARGAAQIEAGAVSGLVRISTIDTAVRGLLLPALGELMARHPRLRIEVNAGNELANLSQRQADIAVRATRRPPPHLVGRELGAIRVAVYASRSIGTRAARALDLSAAPWIAVDDALPEHPSVAWRRRHLPHVVPRLLTNSIGSVLDGIAAGLGVGIVPMFLAQGRGDLVALTAPLDESETQLWLLTHPESRHLRRISTVASHLAERIALA